MAGIDENIVREYFEANGFLVCQANKYQVQSRKKRADENIDFFVENPNPSEGEPAFLMTPAELRKCRRAIVAVKAWHTANFTENMINASKGGIFDFVQKSAVKKAEDFFGDKDGIMKIVACRLAKISRRKAKEHSCNALARNRRSGDISANVEMANRFC